MAVDLNNGSIHAEKFYINPDGNANFAGSHGSGTLGGWEINEDRIFKDSTTGGISLSSARNALEIFDEDNNLTVDINNKNDLSSVIGATFSPTGSVYAGASHTFEITRDVTYGSGDVNYEHHERDHKTYSGGQFNFSIGGNVGENVRMTAVLGNLLLIGVQVDYPAQFNIQLSGRVGMEVYNSDTGGLVWEGYKSFSQTDYNQEDSTLRTGNTELSTNFYKYASNNYHVRFFTQDYIVRFNGDYAQSAVTIDGTFVESLGHASQGSAMVLDANKTEILAGGFQVIKSAAEYFRIDRNSQGFIESSGVFRHNGNYVQTSDKNQKYNIKPIDFDLDLLSNINGYNYSQIINPVHTLNKARAEDICTIESAGLIAQEIEAVLPNAVSTGEDGIKALNYSATTGLLMNIVKQLNDKITLLELEINNLKN